MIHTKIYVCSVGELKKKCSISAGEKGREKKRNGNKRERSLLKKKHIYLSEAFLILSIPMILRAECQISLRKISL